MPGNTHLRRAVAPLAAATATATATAIVAVAVLVAGCSTGSPASSPDASATSASAALAQALKYTACMRSHGIADFPDPNSHGQIAITMNGIDSDLSATDPKFVAAEAACESLQPTEGTPAQQQQDYAAELRYARCMQGRGIAIPDPRPPGSGESAGTQSHSGSGSGGGGTYGTGVSNPSSPQFIAANQACQHYLPAGQGPGGQSLSSGGGS
jgi:hypothetical protein